jgi:tetratricopeptide (TPR) repeat protein
MKMSRSVGKFLVLPVFIGCAALSGVAAGSRSSIKPSDEALQSLQLLHQGRFQAASEGFAQVSKALPDDPEGPLFEGLTTWWKLLDSPKDPVLLRMFQVHLAEATRRGEALMKSKDIQRGRILAGTAHILSAQAHVAQGNYLDAGRAARIGHQYLEEALVADPLAADAWFALGAYKYFADRLSWIVKLLRFMVRIPGGDLDGGLAGLHRASRNGTFFASEADLLLAYIYSSEHEDDYRKALKYLNSARQRTPDSPLYDVIQSRFLFSLGRLAEAEASAQASLELAAKIPGVAANVRDSARVRLSLALYYQYRHFEAQDALAPLLAPDAVVPDASLKTFTSLAARLEHDIERAEARKTGAPPPGRIPPKSNAVRLIAAAPLPRHATGAEALEHLRKGEAGDAAEVLEKLVAAHPGDMISRYHLARAYMASGQHRQAADQLELILGPDVKIPKTLKGWALLRLGSAFEEMGRPGEARVFYQRSSDLKGFVFRRAAEDRLKYPATVPLEG